MQKPYKARSLKAAEKRVNLLRRHVQELDAIARFYKLERDLIARLAATGPAFFNPLDAAEAEGIRNRVLREQRMNPDGTYILSEGNT